MGSFEDVFVEKLGKALIACAKARQAVPLDWGTEIQSQCRRDITVGKPVDYERRIRDLAVRITGYAMVVARQPGISSGCLTPMMPSGTSRESRITPRRNCLQPKSVSSRSSMAWGMKESIRGCKRGRIRREHRFSVVPTENSA
jgi:hypothetical protein